MAGRDGHDVGASQNSCLVSCYCSSNRNGFPTSHEESVLVIWLTEID